ncbi:efflux RND transporter permease subunit [Flammeovirga kamogawensis]|uniref:Multidrug efflux RND transporter permease subunit n=1 Tax=Flammeovirga kamogawensis TaxID=373891 RepID=A0ABX8H1Q3_9BACT|nr:multidrug efflux RND transporter permease subunit [Flammeovirga kamogawensis]MBB6463962.1 HAE1 family hydrophobic/amphiphilic exporter-1 [Flammeovirga kamogawensis]QWG09761.1 multidrug efflux RND transporter permease subunit [Flammeovirga kamogawensis]TRX65272.1 multidrug efflux RND transporter permease subunit [Flammeovirga kamogawensis]
MISKFFINRPIFSAVLAIIIVLTGSIALFNLPIAEYPNITPPTVNVTASYPGASADVIAETVGAPIEQSVNGVENMLYMSSTSNNDGTYSLTITFEVGTDLDIATVLVQNKVAQALPKIPDIVQTLGVVTDKSSSGVSVQAANLVMIAAIQSDDAVVDSLFLSNYAKVYIADEIKRIPGVSNVSIYGVNDYSIRIWMDPSKLKDRGLSSADVKNSILSQNVQVAAGQLGQTPSSSTQKNQYALVVAPGRLTDVDQFKNIIIKTDQQGHTVYLKDVASVELGTKDYNMFFHLKGKQAAGIAIYQLPSANALEIQKQVNERMSILSEKFPQGMSYSVPLDTTKFVRVSIDEVVETLAIAIFLVFIVMFMFLQDWRATLIPAITIPVALIGTFTVMSAMGFSINMLTLFGLVLAIGIVVDDAIVVVENTSRHLEEGKSRKEAAILAMQEVTGPIIATTLVLMSVFLPAASMGGITGELYKQFALTIAVSTLFSAFNALTLSPALCAMILQPKAKDKKEFFIFRWFNAGYNKVFSGYATVLTFAVRKYGISLLVFIAISAFGIFDFTQLPTSFIPQEDQGYVMTSVELPKSASMNRTAEINRQLDELYSNVPGVKTWMTVEGFSIMDGTTAPNRATIFVIFDDWDVRLKKGQDIDHIMKDLSERYDTVLGAQVYSFVPPAISGLGNSGGFQMVILDKGNNDYNTLQKVVDEFVDEGNQQASLSGVGTTFNSKIPQLKVDVKIEKAQMMGISLNTIYDALNAFTGQQYVDDFSRWNRTYQVNIESRADYRTKVDDLWNLYVKSTSGKMISIGSLVDVSYMEAPEIVSRYNLYNAAFINGNAAIGYSSGDALTTMTEMSTSKLDKSMTASWTGLAYQQIKANGSVIFVFLLAVIFVYLVLAAQYESWIDPFGVILAVPLALFGAVISIQMRGLTNDIYMQIGIVLLVALASKNAILIIEFARDNIAKGEKLYEAIVDAAKVRFRPILMTSFAFILGVYPLVIATGAGANSRHSLGTTVFGGMIAATVLAIIFVPSNYYILHKYFSKKQRDLRKK